MLLEVLIAFFIVVMCALPLIFPHVVIYKEQQQFTSKIELDLAVNKFYAEIVQKLYRNEIPWNDIEQSRELSIDDDFLRRAEYLRYLPYIGRYQFQEVRRKRKKDGTFTVYLIKLNFNFVPKNNLNEKPLNYTYDIFVVRDIKTEASDETKNPAPPQPEGARP